MGLKSRFAKIERSFVGGGMRLIAIVAERKVQRGLAQSDRKPRKKGLHVHLDERGKPKP